MSIITLGCEKTQREGLGWQESAREKARELLLKESWRCPKPADRILETTWDPDTTTVGSVRRQTSVNPSSPGHSKDQKT
jgi:hypothetical protein